MFAQAGSQGSQGSQGATGAQGNQGSQGAQGAQGGVSALDDDLTAADHTSDGLKVAMVAAEALAFGDVCYLNSSGKWAKADASAATTSRALAMCADSTISLDATGNFLLFGFARDDTWTWTVGGEIYLSETAGALTQTAPTTASSVTQVMGIAIHADRMYFKPSSDILVHT